MRPPLTERQNQVYEYLRRFIREHQKPPTYKEIGADLALASTNAVHKLVGSLERKGYITRTPRAARGIALADTDDPFVLTEQPPILPLAGSATSASPESLRGSVRTAMIADPRLLGKAKPDDCIVVVADDDGMHGVGIRKGDYLVVEETDWQRLLNGELIAALIGNQVSPRWFEFSKSQFHLRASDRAYRDASFPIDSRDCFIVGRVLGVMRTLG